MRNYTQILASLIICAAAMPAFSQQDEKKENQPNRNDGLKKITNHSHRDWKFDVKIDEDKLERDIERAVETAMRSVEVALDKLDRMEINIDPIEIDLGDLNLDLDPIEIKIPELNIDINIDEDFDHDRWNDEGDHDNWNEDEDDEDDEDNDAWDEDDDDEGDEDHDHFRKEEWINHDKVRENDEIKDKSDKEKGKSGKEKSKSDKEKDKTKGLKKIN